jgi:hypothetical protein
VVPTYFFLEYLKIAEDLGTPLNDLSSCCLTVVLHCAVDSKDENKEGGTVLNLIHKYLGTYKMLVHVLLLILFHFFIISFV